MEELRIKGEEIVKKFELIPEGRKSFYGKMRVYETKKRNLYLESYQTLVAKRVGNTLTVLDWNSPTTTRHIWAFVDYCGCDCVDKNELKKGVKVKKW